MKMFITGDSHGRVSYDAVRHRLEGNTNNLLDSVGLFLLSWEIDDTNKFNWVGQTGQ
jgi:hypothetical protein